MTTVRAAVRMLVTIMIGTIRAMRPGGVRALVAENIALRQQLLVLKRGRKRAPDLRAADRLILALSSLLIRASRFSRVAIAIRPSTLLQFHRALVRRKYSRLFTSKSRAKPGPKGPSAELRAAILSLKERNPGFGSPRIWHRHQ